MRIPEGIAGQDWWLVDDYSKKGPVLRNIGLVGNPCGMWTTSQPAWQFQVEEARVTLRIATELGRTKVLAGGLWWTWRPIPGRSSSVGEQLLHTQKIGGSNPPSATTKEC